MNGPQLRQVHAPAEMAAHAHREAEAAAVAAQLAAGGPHHAEVMAAHGCSPPPAGVTPPSGGFSGHGAPGG